MSKQAPSNKTFISIEVHQWRYKCIHALKPSWYVLTWKFVFTWVLNAVVLCLHSCSIVTSSRVHSDALSEEGGVDLRLVIPI